MFRLPAALRAVRAHPAERSLYAGGADGRIFEVGSACAAVPRACAAPSRPTSVGLWCHVRVMDTSFAQRPCNFSD